jgi:hypothetical protein
MKQPVHARPHQLEANPSLSFGALRGNCPHASSLRKTPTKSAVPAELRASVLRQSEAVAQPSQVEMFRLEPSSALVRAPGR